MITSVRIQNWRAYKSFELDLKPGTTFLVAPNGVGKTSFIEAVRWALNPDAKPTAAVMRRLSKETSVDVHVDAGVTQVRIRRTLTVGRGKTPATKVEAWIDGSDAEPSLALQLLADRWEADNRFACRAAFLTDRFVDKDPEPDLRSHLARLHGLDNIQTAVASLGAALTAATAQADSARKATAASDVDLERAVEDAGSAVEHLEGATAQSEALRAEVTTADGALAQARRANEALAAYKQWMVERRTLASEVTALLGAVVEDTDLRPALRSAESGARRQLIEVTEQRARLRERLAAVEGTLQRLYDAEGECPVCRRPLDDASREHAEEQHEHDRSLASEQLDTLGEDRSGTLADKLRPLLARAEALGDPPPEPVGDPIDLTPLEANAAATRAAYEEALEEVGRAQQIVIGKNAKVASIEAARGARSPASLYTTVAALEAAKAALESTVTQVLEAQLGSVSEEVNRRWEAIFPDRPGLRLDSTGQVARTFDDDGDDLDFESFSSGEQVVAKLLLRLATLTSTTKVPFCLIDEPLEHLDPDARSYVARTLAYLGTGGALRQIFVTTYEQDLALQLADLARDQVRLEFLRTAQVYT